MEERVDWPRRVRYGKRVLCLEPRRIVVVVQGGRRHRQMIGCREGPCKQRREAPQRRRGAGAITTPTPRTFAAMSSP